MILALLASGPVAFVASPLLSLSSWYKYLQHYSLLRQLLHGCSFQQLCVCIGSTL
jgi:hypothetical protein